MDSLIAELTAYITAARLLVSWSCAGLCLVAYDYLLTFDSERLYIWGTALTPGNILFLAIRYLPFIDLSLIIYDQSNPGASEGICTAVIWWYQFSCILALALADGVIGLRTWAIWGRSKICATLVAVVWMGAMGSSLYFQVTALREDSYYPTPAGFDLPGCIFYTSDTSTLTNMYTIYAVYQTFIFIATLVRGVGHLRYNPAKVMSIIYRDAFISSAVLFVIAILNIVMLKVSPDWSYGLTSLYRAMYAILPERIILNLREASMATNINGSDITIEPPPKRGVNGEWGRGGSASGEHGEETSS